MLGGHRAEELCPLHQPEKMWGPRCGSGGDQVTQSSLAGRGERGETWVPGRKVLWPRMGLRLGVGVRGERMSRVGGAGPPRQGRAAWLWGPDGQAGGLGRCPLPSESGRAFSLFLPPKTRAAGAAGSVWRVVRGHRVQSGLGWTEYRRAQLGAWPVWAEHMCCPPPSGGCPSGSCLLCRLEGSEECKGLGPQRVPHVVVSQLVCGRCPALLAWSDWGPVLQEGVAPRAASCPAGGGLGAVFPVPGGLLQLRASRRQPGSQLGLGDSSSWGPCPVWAGQAWLWEPGAMCLLSPASCLGFCGSRAAAQATPGWTSRSV